ncbi:MAG TPA: hypothetical protein VK335_22005 [Bryobacteraceae bacterium]|nr:hypothetical protein [Bryobacteraceae bacterium]
MTALRAMQGRAISSLNFEELEEIGLLTTRLATLEEIVAFFCEVLLIRPELSRFSSHSRNKPVLTEQISEKLRLYRKLLGATGVLDDTLAKAIGANIRAIKDVAEDRNAIVHGFLCQRDSGGAAFSIHGRLVPAALDSLRSLTKRCQVAAVELQALFAAFYSDLSNRKPINPIPEAKLLVALQAMQQWHTSSYTVRESTLKLRTSQGAALDAFQKREESKRQMDEAITKLQERKKSLTRTREELRFARKRARWRK